MTTARTLSTPHPAADPRVTSRPAPGDQLAVVSEGGATVTLLDAVDHRVRSVLDVPAEPHELCFDPAHRLLWCTSTYLGGYYGHHEGHNHLLTVIDPDAGHVVEIIDISPEHGPHGLALDPARGLLYVSVEAGPAGPGGILVVDTTTRRVLRRLDTRAPGPHWITVDVDRRRGYAANKEAPFVTVVDLDTGDVLDTIAVPGSEGITTSPDGSIVAVAAPRVGTRRAEPGVRLIDTRTHEIVRTVRTERGVRPVHWTDTGLLLVGTPGRLTVCAGPTAAQVEPIGRIEVGADPLTITSAPDGRRGYVAAITDSTVSVVDLTDPAAPALLDTVTVPARHTGAHGLAYLPTAA